MIRIIIELDTDADPSDVLEFAQEAAESLVSTLQDHGEAASFDEGTGVTVQS